METGGHFIGKGYSSLEHMNSGLETCRKDAFRELYVRNQLYIAHTREQKWTQGHRQRDIGRKRFLISLLVHSFLYKTESDLSYI